MATYVWSKYTLDERYYLSWSSYTERAHDLSNQLRFYTSYTFDSNTGIISPVGERVFTNVFHSDEYIGWCNVVSDRGDRVEILRKADIYGNYAYLTYDVGDSESEYVPDVYLGQVTSSSRYYYPDNGEDDGYWYIYQGIIPSIPSKITCSPPDTVKSGNVVKIEWSASDGDGYRLYREFNGNGTWIQIYSGKELSFTDTIPKSNYSSVRYRVTSYNDLGESLYQTAPSITVINNSPPSIPSRISVPSSINHGNTIKISWGASTDEDGNFSGYEVERLYDFGSWERIYRGTAKSTSHTIPRNTYKKVQYRVRAYDAESDYSGYRTSSVCTIINNRAPNSPSAISIPDMIVADGVSTFTVSWKASTDSDGNLSGYILERSFDGQVFSQIYKGPLTEFTETTLKIGEHTSVQYRVRAYDTDNAYSAYVTTAIKQIVNNHAPEIISSTHQNNQDIGEVYDDGIQVAYSVTDEDNDAVTAYELINNKLIREYSPNLGNENILNLTGDDWKKVLNGENITRIEATDGKSAMMFTIRFTKKVHHVRVSLKNPLSNGYPITLCKLVVEGNIPEDAVYKVEVTNNGRDDEPIWEDCTDAVRKGIYYRFKNSVHEKGWGLKFRIYCKRGKNGESQTGGYILFVNGVYG